MIRIRLAVPERPTMTMGIGRWASMSSTLARLQGASAYCGREEAPDAEAQKARGEEHEDQGKEEVGYGQPDKADHRGRVVAGGVLVGGRVDADRDRHEIGEDQGADRHRPA